MYRCVRAALPALTALSLAGCLSTVHRVPDEELQQLAHDPPRERSQRVRVIQEFIGGETPPEAQPVNSGTRVYVGGHVAVSSSPSSPKGPNFKKPASAKADDARWWLIAAALAGVTLAATEGARFDGWAELHPMHPVHLYGPYGRYTQVPLAQIQPETARWAERAYVRETEGPWRRLERAPLNRVGFTYSVLFGAAQIPSAAEKNAFGAGSTGEPGFLGHIQLGVFPAQYLGVLLDFGLGYRQNDFGDTVFEARNALELQVLPFSAGKLHAGGYGDVGIGLRAEDGAKTSSEKRAFLGGAGGLLQLELTTRLTITGRVGVTRIFGETTSEASLGLSIY